MDELDCLGVVALIVIAGGLILNIAHEVLDKYK